MTAEERIEKTFGVEGTPQLVVSNVRGSIKVQSADRDDVHVLAIKRVNGDRDPERTEVEIYQEAGRIVARTRYRKGNGWLDRMRGDRVCPVDYTVEVPSQCDVDVKQVTGAVHVSGVSGRVTVNAVEGAVEVREITGRAKVGAVSANVDGEGWSGRAQVNTVSGAVKIVGAQLARVKANTVSGDVSLETTVDEHGRYDFNSVSGDVTFYIPSEHGVETRGATLSGRLLCDLPHEYTRRGRGNWRATVNGGGPPVRFHSVSGDLEVLAAAE